jgi:hypothetical protein
MDFYAIRKLGTDECYSGSGWTEDLDDFARYDSLFEAQEAVPSISGMGYVEIVRLQIQITEAELFDVLEIFEEATR